MKRPVWILTILLAGGPLIGTLAAAPPQGLSASVHATSYRPGDRYYTSRHPRDRRNRYRNRRNRGRGYYRNRGRGFSQRLRRDLRHNLRRLQRSKRYCRPPQRHRHRPHRY